MWGCPYDLKPERHCTYPIARSWKPALLPVDQDKDTMDDLKKRAKAGPALSRSLWGEPWDDGRSWCTKRQQRVAFLGMGLFPKCKLEVPDGQA